MFKKDDSLIMTPTINSGSWKDKTDIRQLFFQE